MNREEYNTLFHRLQLNLVAFKRLMDCDEEVLKLVNAAIEAERERVKWDGIHSCHPECDKPVCVAIRKAVAEERERGWQELTDEEIRRWKPVCADFESFRAGIRAIEAKLKEKNGE